MLGGLGGRAAWEKMQSKKKLCERCGLHYRESLDKCRWCGDLDEDGLSQLLAKKEQQFQSNKSLGRIFFVIVLLIIILLALM